MSAKEAEEAIRVSIEAGIIIEDSVVTLGGEGGKAPGSGGGGGGSIGDGATGGAGGAGGNIYVFDGTPGAAPGAGGGGAGLVRPNAVGGEGGGGGEYIYGFFRADELPDSIEITIGEGGNGATALTLCLRISFVLVADTVAGPEASRISRER